jgi:hypothetical protein
MKKILFLVLLVMLTATETMAWNINIPAGYGQGEFKDLTRDLGSAIGYRNLVPAEPLGVLGFDVSAQTSFIEIDDNSSYWSAVTDDAPGYITAPSIRVRKGLPFGIDIGAMYTYIADTDIQVYGAEISKAILEGSVATPALGVRATYSRLSGIDDMSLQTAGIDASISKGILIFTPYAGVGMLWIDGKYDGNTPGVSLDQESFWQSRGFAGLKITPIPLVSVTAEAEYAVRPIYSLKVGINF